MLVDKEVLLMSDVNDLLEKAIYEIKFLKKGEIFLVRDLFKGYEWKRIPRNDRLLLGTLFLNHINRAEDGVMAIEKTSSNQQQYKIINNNIGIED